MSETLDMGDVGRQKRRELRESLHGKTKTEQQGIIRACRTERPRDYRQVSGIQRWDRRHYIAERHLKRSLETVQTIEALFDVVRTLPASYRAEGIMHGTLLAEHVLKQTELAVRFKTTVPISSPSLKAALEHCIPDVSSNLIPSESYSQYLTERVPSIVLNDTELNRFMEKVPPEVWVTIDLELEAPVLLANAQERIFTTACCSGHEMEDDKARAYMTMQTDDPLLIQVIKNSNRGRKFFSAWAWDRLGSFTARSPHDKRTGITFEQAQKGWTFNCFDLPTIEDRERFAALTPEERKREREDFVQYIVATLERYRGLRK